MAGVDQATKRPNILVFLAVLVGLPLAQALVSPGLIERSTELLGRPWFPFFGWVVILEWSLLGLVVWSLRSRKMTLKSLGWPGVRRRDVAIVGIGAAGMVLFILWVGESTSPRILDGSWILPRTQEEKLFMLLVAMTAAICEELLYRGYLYESLRALRLPASASVALALASFALIHGPHQPLPLLLLRLGAGAVFFALFFWRGNLRAAIYLHLVADAQFALST